MSNIFDSGDFFNRKTSGLILPVDGKGDWEDLSEEQQKGFIENNNDLRLRYLVQISGSFPLKNDNIILYEAMYAFVRVFYNDAKLSDEELLSIGERYFRKLEHFSKPEVRKMTEILFFH